ncbi:HD domain-containing protein [Patescibacteria group bacterium]|nr:HD domain-containing protein [Patescibacteria group bacterium]
MKYLNEIRELVKNEADDSDWKYHIAIVIKYAKQLAKILKTDEDMAELGAILHDIGRLRHGSENHNVTGVIEAEKILKDHNAPQEVIDEIKHCVETHRAIKDLPPKTITAKIVMNADAMSHFDEIPIFFYWKIGGDNFENIFKWVEAKIERDWNEKLTLPEAKEMMREKYEAIKVVLSSTKEHI